MFKRVLLATLLCCIAACVTNRNDTGAANNAATGGGDGNQTKGPTWPGCSTDGLMTQGSQPSSCNAAQAADVNIVIDAAAGSKSFATPHPISNQMWSMGIDDQTRGDYFPTLSPTFVNYLKALHPAFLRFPAGYNGQHYSWGTTDGNHTMTPRLLDSFVALCHAVGAEPYLAVNMETAPMSDALSELTYANITKKYGVKWWQIGNEPNLAGLYSEENPNFYTQTYLQYRQAMLNIDPNLHFVAIESYTGEGLNHNFNQPNWLNPFLSQITPGQVDAFAYHYYPLTSASSYNFPNSSIVPSIAHLLQEDATDWPPSALDYPDKIMPYMRQQLGNAGVKAQVWVDEMAEDSGSLLNGVGYGDVMLGALWAADSLGRYADQGTDATFHFIFKAVSPTTTYGYTLIDPNDVPRPEYFTYWLYANQFGDNMVNSSSDNIANVAAHAALRAEDCSLRVMLVNKATTAQKVHLTLKGYTPVSASQYNLVGTAYQSGTVTINNMQLTDVDITQGADAVPAASAPSCSDNVITLPAYSVNLVVFKKTAQ